MAPLILQQMLCNALPCILFRVFYNILLDILAAVLRLNIILTTHIFSVYCSTPGMRQIFIL